jgi:peroxiredoxin family protein
MSGTIEKVSIIVSKGSLEGIYPGLIMANAARAEGIEANLFFTFFGLDAISRKRHEHIKVASVGNPGLHLATIAGALPGMPGLLTAYMERKMGKLDMPAIPEFIEMIADTGAGLYGCQASCDLFGLGKDDLIDQVTGIIIVGEFLRPRGRRPDHLHLNPRRLAWVRGTKLVVTMRVSVRLRCRPAAGPGM